jgi:hypothetical protein
VSVPPEIRQRILEEEKIRVEAQERFKEEIRLRQHTAALFTRVFLLVLCHGAARLGVLPTVATGSGHHGSSCQDPPGES